jgi:hypothetical protein
MLSWEILRAKIAAFEEALRTGDKDAALAIVQTTGDCTEAEEYVHLTLGHAQRDAVLLRATLTKFEASRIPSPKEHGYWVHSLSHFAEKLWHLGEVAWLKTGYQTAFNGAYQLGNFTCCEHLLYAFAYYAPWSEDPAEYGVDLSRLPPKTWGRWNQHAKQRLEASPFSSELEFCRFLLQTPKLLRDQRDRNIVNLARIRALILRQAEAGNDVLELLKCEDSLLRQDLAQVRIRAGKADVGYERDSAQRTVQMLRWAVADDESEQ